MTPWAENPAERLSAWGETALLHAIRKWLGPVAPPSPRGMGDDTAVLPPGKRNLYTSDSLVFGTHFDASLAPEKAGAKLLKRNLSDIAAMGGEPREAVLAGFLPPHTSQRWLERFTRGLAASADAWDVSVVGGDLTQTEGFLGFNLTLLGVTRGEPLLRTGAAVGDALWVTGTLGGSIRDKHHSFLPRLPEGSWLGRRGRDEIRALIDVTDGLAKDLPALLPADGAAALDPGALPLSEDCRRAAEASGQPPLVHALCDGEDYELLFATAASVDPATFAEAWKHAFATPLSCIGRIVEASPDNARKLLDAHSGKPLLSGSGYEHFGAT